MNTIETAIHELREIGVSSFNISQGIGESPTVLAVDCKGILHKTEELTVLASLQAMLLKLNK